MGSLYSENLNSPVGKIWDEGSSQRKLCDFLLVGWWWSNKVVVLGILCSTWRYPLPPGFLQENSEMLLYVSSKGQGPYPCAVVFCWLVCFVMPRACRILIPWAGMEPCCLQRKQADLTTGRPGKSLHFCFLTAPALFLCSLSSLISNRLNHPFGTHQKSRALNEAYILQTRNVKGLYPGEPHSVLLSFSLFPLSGHCE